MTLKPPHSRNSPPRSGLSSFWSPMATSPLQSGFADSEMPADEAGQPATSEGMLAELCIGVMQDGSLTVYKETGPEAQEQESPRQPAATIGEALKMVLELYKSMAPQDGDDAFQAGYSADEPQQQQPQRGGMMR
jgi:hypothetical protein